jgi:hypothetical protein
MLIGAQVVKNISLCEYRKNRYSVLKNSTFDHSIYAEQMQHNPDTSLKAE